MEEILVVRFLTDDTCFEVAIFCHFRLIPLLQAGDMDENAYKYINRYWLFLFFFKNLDRPVYKVPFQCSWYATSYYYHVEFDWCPVKQ